MTETARPLEIFVDDCSSAIFGPHNSKIVFSSVTPSPEGNKDRDVITLVIPTDALLAVCLQVLDSVAKNGAAIAGHSTDVNRAFQSAVAALGEVAETKEYVRVIDAYQEVEMPKLPSKRRTKAKAH